MRLTDPLRDLLVDLARRHEYLPPGPLEPAETIRTRADQVAQIALAAIDKIRDDKTLTSDHLHKAVQFSFLTGIDNAYAHYQGKQPNDPGPESVFDQATSLDCVPPHLARLYAALDMPAKLHNAGFKWILDNKGKVAEAGLSGTDCVYLVLYYAYLIGSGRAMRMLEAEKRSSTRSKA